MIVADKHSSGAFFSVRYNCVINGQSFRPAVCYRLTGGLQKVVEEMREKDMARIYPAEVRFVSGVAYPVRKAPSMLETRVSSGPAPSTGISAPSAPAASSTGLKGGTGGFRKGSYVRQGKQGSK